MGDIGDATVHVGSIALAWIYGCLPLLGRSLKVPATATILATIPSENRRGRDPGVWSTEGTVHEDSGILVVRRESIDHGIMRVARRAALRD